MKFLAGILAVSLLFCAGCSTMAPSTKAGAGIGAIVGGVAGAAIDKENSWRGGVIGAVAGGLLGAVIGDIVDQASKEAARRNTPVKYSRTTNEGWREDVIAEPISTRGDYRVVSIKHIRDGEVISEEIKTIPIR
ncbi:MAG: YMGG-like glycine zipper-containing protein [Candidatus Omnitrophota bacterium]